MATETTTPATGTADRNPTPEKMSTIVQLAQADAPANGTAPTQAPAIPAVPNGEVHVTVPAGQTVIRVQVAPGETIDLPFDDSGLAARFGQQGNLAIKEGDETIILLNYAEANQQEGVTVHDSQGHDIDVATVVAQTDPNLDIQTAAGPAAGPAGAAGGHLFLDFNPGAGLGGFGELNVINPTALQYGLISPDETITRAHDLTNGTNNGLSISSTDGSKTIALTDVPTSNTPSGSTDDGSYLNGGNKEGVAADPGLVTGHGYHSSDLGLSGTESSSLTVTYESDSAAYHNIVGAYITEPDGTVVVQLLWLDNPSGKDFLGNDGPSSVNLNNIPAGSDVQFFLLQDGAANAHDEAILKAAAGGGGNGYDTDMSAINSQLSMAQDSTGRWHIYVNGQELTSEMFVTDDSINGNDNQQAIDGTDGANTLFVGFEDKGLHSGADKDYNDVILGVQSTSSNPTANVTTVNPSVLLGDTNSNITEATIDTTGFMVGDSLSNLPPDNTTTADGFHVSYTQDASGDYHIDVTQTTDHTTAQWQAFLNSIGFETSSKTDGERDINYGITDAAGNHGTTSSAIDVTHTHSDYLSTETNLNHNDHGLLHDGGTAGHNVTWGAGDDTLFLDQHFTSTDGKLDMGAGDNTLAVAGNNMNVTSADLSHLTNLDHIDLTGHGTNVATLNGEDLLSAEGSSHIVKIDGDSADQVNLGGNTADGHWTTGADVAIGGETYHQYTWTATGGGSVTVQVDEHLHQQVTPALV